MPDTRLIITGCSGGGKSTLLAELGRRGFATVAEPGRAIVREQRAAGGTALPWTDAAAFGALAIARGVANLAAADPDRITFFDRSPVDNIAALTAAGLPVPDHPPVRFCRTVFVAPPWRRIFVQDRDRRHGFDAAVREYRALLPAYAALGCHLVELPRRSVAARADMVLARLGLG